MTAVRGSGRPPVALSSVILRCWKWRVGSYSLAADWSAERCLEPMSEGACGEYVLLWYFHLRSGECRPFVYGGCGGNANRFQSKRECQSLCGATERSREEEQPHR